LEMQEKARKAKLGQSLFNSVRLQDVSSIHSLVAQNADVDTLDTDSWTPLLVASVVNTTHLEKRDRDGHNDDYKRAQEDAVYASSNRVCEVLLRLHADPCYTSPRGGPIPLP
jgi:ankyrin repeat protein